MCCHTCFLVPNNHLPACPETLLALTVIKPTTSSQREVDHLTLYELVDGHGSTDDTGYDIVYNCRYTVLARFTRTHLGTSTTSNLCFIWMEMVSLTCI